MTGPGPDGPMRDSARSPRTGLGRAAMFGAASQILARGGRALVGIATVAVFTRYLEPADFGIFALVLFVVGFAQLFSELGLRSALVRKAEITDLETDSVFWFSLGCSVLLALALYAGADPVARLMGEPRLRPYLEISTALFVIAAFRAIPLTLLERAFRFPAIASSEIVGAVCGALVAVAAVMAGFGIEALIAQQFVMTILPTAMNMIATRWLPRFRFSIEAIRPLLGFGVSMTATNMVGYLSGTIDRPILGNRLPTADLGILTVASQIVASPVRTIAMNARRVTFPILSSIKTDDARIAAAHKDSLHAMFVVMAPACFGMAALAEPLTTVLLGTGWTMVKDIVGVSAMSALVWSICEMHASIFSVKGAVGFLFRWSLFVVAGTSAVLLLSASHGLMAIVWSRLAWDLFVFVLFSWFLGRLIKTGVGDLLAPLLRPLLAAALMGAVVLFVDGRLADLQLAPLVRLVAGTALGVVMYGACLIAVDRPRIFQLADRVRNRRTPPPRG